MSSDGTSTHATSTYATSKGRATPARFDPYCLGAFCTEAAKASAAAATRRVEALRAVPGALATTAGRKLAAQARVWAEWLEALRAHNRRVEMKERMLRDADWRARVLHDLGGERALARWERAWAKWRAGGAEARIEWEMPSEAEFFSDEADWANEEDGFWEDEVAGENGEGEDWGENLWAPASAGVSGRNKRHGPRVCRDAVFRWAAIPRGTRGRREPENAIAAKWGGRLERLAAKARREAERVAEGQTMAAPESAAPPRGQYDGMPIPVSGDELRGEWGEEFQADFDAGRPAGRELDAGMRVRLEGIVNSEKRTANREGRGEFGDLSGWEESSVAELVPEPRVAGCENFELNQYSVPGLSSIVPSNEGEEPSRARSRMDREAIFRESGIGEEGSDVVADRHVPNPLDGEVASVKEVES